MHQKLQTSKKMLRRVPVSSIPLEQFSFNKEVILDRTKLRS